MCVYLMMYLEHQNLCMLEFVLNTYIWTCRRVSVDDGKGEFSYALDLKTTTCMTMGNTCTLLIFLNLEQDGSEWSASRSSYFTIIREPVRPIQIML